MNKNSSKPETATTPIKSGNASKDITLANLPSPYAQVPVVLIDDLRKGLLEPIDIATFVALAACSIEKPVSWHGRKSLAGRLGCSLKTLDRSRKRLSDANHIKMTPRGLGQSKNVRLLTRVDNGQVVQEGAQSAHPKTQSPKEGESLRLNFQNRRQQAKRPKS